MTEGSIYLGLGAGGDGAKGSPGNQPRPGRLCDVGNRGVMPNDSTSVDVERGSKQRQPGEASSEGPGELKDRWRWRWPGEPRSVGAKIERPSLAMARPRGDRREPREMVARRAEGPEGGGPACSVERRRRPGLVSRGSAGSGSLGPASCFGLAWRSGSASVTGWTGRGDWFGQWALAQPGCN